MKKPHAFNPGHPRTRLSRRSFLSGAAAAAATLAANPLGATGFFSRPSGSGPGGGFKLRYAPPFGMFAEHAGKNPVDQLKFMADQGFRAFFDNGLMNRPAADQEAISGEARRLGLDAGPFVAYADFGKMSFVTRDPEIREMLVGKIRTAVETSKRTGVKQTLLVPGRIDERLEWDYQTANVVENLRFLAEICESEGLVMVIEPLNPKDHPGLFLTRIPQAFQICRAVGSPACKIVNDLYHQQITEGELIRNIDRAWDEIAAFHVGDNPGRREPGTGEINYRNIFKHLHAKGTDPVICMEHGKSISGKDGEAAVIAAYRACDDFA